MRKTLALILVISFCLIPALAAAEVTVLASEEMRVGVNDDLQAAVDAVVKKAIESAKKHPCVVAAEKEGRTLNIGVKVSIAEVTETHLVSVIELVTEDCK